MRNESIIQKEWKKKYPTNVFHAIYNGTTSTRYISGHEYLIYIHFHFGHKVTFAGRLRKNDKKVIRTITLKGEFINRHVYTQIGSFEHNWTIIDDSDLTLEKLIEKLKTEIIC